MQAEKKVIIEVKTTDRKIVDKCDTVYLVANGYTIAGTFNGISKKGAWIFKGIGKFEDVTFNIMPKSISEMYLAEVNICG